jgi:hypothetical protein
MPEPRATPRSLPVAAIWPATLPAPQAGSLSFIAPARVSLADVLSGPTRLYLTARTAPGEWTFAVWLSPTQMYLFEDWYRQLIALTGGEFYARWIGGARLTAFAAPYEYTPIGRSWVLTGRLVRTRTDPSICDVYIEAAFGELLIDDGVSADVVVADLAATDVIADDFDLALIAANEC